MGGSYPVRITVVSQQGHCDAGHKVGDSWLIDENKTPGGICLGAFNPLAPNVRVLRFGGEYPWAEDKDATTIACPDAVNPVVFEVRRLR
ncbi:MAG TPA: TIGR04076 family protein [Dehalococcoidia bacterium]|nr:TIGR04076 family protein [Dehalococcoidia bacterium]